MSDKKFKMYEWVLGICILTCGNFIYGLSYWTQENAYGRPNFLKPLSSLLWDQTSATSVGLVIAACGICIAASSLFYSSSRKYLLIMRPLGMLLIGAVYTWYEYYQWLHPLYHDNNGADILGCWLMIFTVLGLWLRSVIKNTR